jgi:hypothetical protein
MPLGSNLFKDSKRLAECEISHAAHVVPGDRGDHVRLIQIALQEIEGAEIDGGELAATHYGPSTARAVLAYKTKRRIINFSYQSTADNVVGKMTIVSLDKDMLSLQRTPRPAASKQCPRPGVLGSASR